RAAEDRRLSRHRRAEIRDRSRERARLQGRMIVRRALKIALVAVLCAVPLSARAAAVEELKRVYYGTTASPAHLPVWVAKDAGLFAPRGLDVLPVQIRGGSLITLVIMTGALPFSGVGAESVVAARVAGGDIVLLACPVDVEPVYLVARPEIKSAADLKGQASAVTRYGSSTPFYLTPPLRSIRLDP